MKPSLRTLGPAFGLLMAMLAIEAPAAERMTRLELFQQVHRRSDDLARYVYLLTILPRLGPDARNPAMQLLAFTENELGLYIEALRDFPLRMRLPPTLELPSPAQWQAEDAVDAISALAAQRQIVMVNEAHHDAHTRVLTLALLRRLRSKGFSYFAAEALDSRDQGLSKRGYPLLSSGTEYLHEPIYGEIIREALKLGYTVVAYEADANTGAGQAREDVQARNLYQRIFARDPQARLLIHAGYAHIDRKPARLGSVRPMAMRLQQLSGITALTIDQADIREEHPKRDAAAVARAIGEAAKIAAILKPPVSGAELLDPHASRSSEHRGLPPYDQLISAYRPSSPIVLRSRTDNRYWSARPDTYDISVVLPLSTTESSDYSNGAIWLLIDGKRVGTLPPASGGSRPRWLSLNGQRRALIVSSEPCGTSTPCLVEARYAAESDEAVPADRYVFIDGRKQASLYLRPDTYRVRYTASNGATLGETRQRVTGSD